MHVGFRWEGRTAYARTKDLVGFGGLPGRVVCWLCGSRG